MSRNNKRKYNAKINGKKHNCPRTLSDLNPVILEKQYVARRRLTSAFEAFLALLCISIPYIINAPVFLKDNEKNNHLPFLIGGAFLMLFMGTILVYEVLAYFAVRIIIEKGIFNCKNCFHDIEFSILDIQEIRCRHNTTYFGLDLYIELDGRSKCLNFSSSSWDTSEIARFLLEADEAEKHNGRLFTADERLMLKQFRR